MPSFAAAFDRSNKGFGIKEGIKNLISHTERVKAVVIGSGFGGSIAACNPSLTIAAFAERSMKNILENDL